MKVKILSTDNKSMGDQEIPSQFDEPVRMDLIQRAVFAQQMNRRQKYGASPDAGKRSSAIVSKRRNSYKTSYGKGIARTPRKVMSARGTQFNWEGAFAPNTKGGRRAHPPKAEKEWNKDINQKERRKAIRSALSASFQKDFVTARGHMIPDTYPFVLDQKFESIEKTKDAKKALLAIGFEAELKRASVKTIRAGKGKLRGRKYKKRKGPVIIVGQDCKLQKAARNIPGIEVVKVNQVNTELLAPGAQPGRIALFTTSAMEKLSKENLFM